MRLHRFSRRTSGFWKSSLRHARPLSVLGASAAFPVGCKCAEASPTPTQQVFATSVVVARPYCLVQSVNAIVHRVCRNLRDFLSFSARLTEILVILLPMAVLAPTAMLAEPLLHHNYVSDLSWSYFCYSMNLLGPVFVKLCQWVATRRDIFPTNVTTRLAKLQDRVHPPSWRQTHSMLTQELGDYEAEGLTIDRHKPLGCGSAATVFRGTLHRRRTSGGTEDRAVAIKVLHPHLQNRVDRDLWLVKIVAEWLHSLPVAKIRMLNIPRASEIFGSVLRRQADLRIEGSNLLRFTQNFSQAEDSHIVFPSPVEGWVRRNILVEDLIQDAQPISDVLHSGSDQVKTELASLLLRAFLKMVFVSNFTHSDVHPGNVMVQTVKSQTEPGLLVRYVFGKSESKEVTKHKIVFLDAGIATSLAKNDLRNLRDLFRAIILNDGKEAGHLMVERAKYERCSQVPGGVEAFSNGIDKLVREFHDNRKTGLTLGAVRIGSLLNRVLDLCREHGVEIDPAMASIVISTLVLEGLGRSLDPNLNLIDFAVPFVLGRGKV